MSTDAVPTVLAALRPLLADSESHGRQRTRRCDLSQLLPPSESLCRLAQPQRGGPREDGTLFRQLVGASPDYCTKSLAGGHSPACSTTGNARTGVEDNSTPKAMRWGRQTRPSAGASRQLRRTRDRPMASAAEIRLTVCWTRRLSYVSLRQLVWPNSYGTYMVTRDRFCRRGLCREVRK
jgi:hypothetical protein